MGLDKMSDLIVLGLVFMTMVLLSDLKLGTIILRSPLRNRHHNRLMVHGGHHRTHPIYPDR